MDDFVWRTATNLLEQLSGLSDMAGMMAWLIYCCYLTGVYRTLALAFSVHEANMLFSILNFFEA